MSHQRSAYLAGLFLCAVLIAVALYFQYVQGLEPCPLCIFQRVVVMALGVVMLVAAIHDGAGASRRIYAGVCAVLAAIGAAIAGRHVWLQNLPEDEVPECGPGLDYMLDAFPFAEALEMVLKGSGECAEVQWTFLTLSIPAWTLVVFCAALVVALLFVWRPPGSARSV